MSSRPSIIAFDVVGTLFPLDPLRPRLEAAGLPAEALETWFARTLRDGIALAATDSFRPFSDVARAVLEGLCDEHGLGGGQAAKTALDAVEALSGLPADPAAGAAFEALAAADIRIMALTNGSASVTKELLSKARLDRLVGHVVSIEEVRLWKPRREVYLRAAEVAGVFPPALGLVAAHGWDVHGARQAGLPAAFVARGRVFPPHMEPPNASGETLEAAARALCGLPAAG